jgi:hypothetical protein
MQSDQTQYAQDPQNNIEAELDHYVNITMNDLITQQMEIDNDINFIITQNLDDASALAMQRDKILPESQKLANEAASIIPVSDEIRKVHELFIAGVEKNNESLTLSYMAYLKSDYTKATEVKELRNEAKKYFRDYVACLRDLVVEYDITVTGSAYQNISD